MIKIVYADKQEKDLIKSGYLCHEVVAMGWKGGDFYYASKVFLNDKGEGKITSIRHQRVFLQGLETLSSYHSERFVMVAVNVLRRKPEPTVSESEWLRRFGLFLKNHYNFCKYFSTKYPHEDFLKQKVLRSKKMNKLDVVWHQRLEQAKIYNKEHRSLFCQWELILPDIVTPKPAVKVKPPKGLKENKIGLAVVPDHRLVPINLTTQHFKATETRPQFWIGFANTGRGYLVKEKPTAKLPKLFILKTMLESRVNEMGVNHCPDWDTFIKRYQLWTQLQKEKKHANK